MTVAETSIGPDQTKTQVDLKSDPQTELNLSGSTERVDTGSYPNAIHIVSCTIGSVDLAGRLIQGFCAAPRSFCIWHS